LLSFCPAELTDAKTRAIVWTGRGAKEAPVRDRSVDGVVQALNEALADSLEQITRSLVPFLRKKQ
jgi:hypothetical protein